MSSNTATTGFEAASDSRSFRNAHAMSSAEAALSLSPIACINGPVTASRSSSRISAAILEPAAWASS